VVTNVDGIKVLTTNLLISPTTSDLQDNLCGISFSSEKPRLEVKVLSLPEGGMVSVGIGTPEKFRSQPGWCSGTWGYHSDDGHLFHNGVRLSNNMGPFHEGDVIVMSFQDGDGDHKELIIGKNGKQVGKIQYHHYIPPYTPSGWVIGMDKSGTVVHFSTMK